MKTPTIIQLSINGNDGPDALDLDVVDQEGTVFLVESSFVNKMHDEVGELHDEVIRLRKELAKLTEEE